MIPAPRISSFSDSNTDGSFERENVILRVFTLSVIIMARVRSYGSILDVSHHCPTLGSGQ